MGIWGYEGPTKFPCHALKLSCNSHRIYCIHPWGWDVYMQTCINIIPIHTSVYIHVQFSIYIPNGIHINIYIYIYRERYIYIYTYTYYIYIYIYIYIHIYIYIYLQNPIYSEHLRTAWASSMAPPCWSSASAPRRAPCSAAWPWLRRAWPGRSRASAPSSAWPSGMLGIHCWGYEKMEDAWDFEIGFQEQKDGKMWC